MHCAQLRAPIPSSLLGCIFALWQSAVRMNVFSYKMDVDFYPTSIKSQTQFLLLKLNIVIQSKIICSALRGKFEASGFAKVKVHIGNSFTDILKLK